MELSKAFCKTLWLFFFGDSYYFDDDGWINDNGPYSWGVFFLLFLSATVLFSPSLGGIILGTVPPGIHEGTCRDPPWKLSWLIRVPFGFNSQQRRLPSTFRVEVVVSPWIRRSALTQGVGRGERCGKSCFLEGRDGIFTRPEVQKFTMGFSVWLENQLLSIPSNLKPLKPATVA